MNQVLSSFKIRDFYIRVQLTFILFTSWRSSSLSVEIYVNILHILCLITDLYVECRKHSQRETELYFNLFYIQKIELFKTRNLYSS